ncbi:MAG: hypothetical protein IID50_10070 [Proteobacteria bacterium]|nr:hypothetical protein [Pseudomonadota bacterium]
MPQSVLDPKNKTVEGKWKPDGPLPRRVRKFGRYPNFADWHPGDLLLFHKSEKPSLVSKLIIKAQESSFDFEHARWHHAAVYVGDGFLCEANIFPGVQYRPIHDYVGKHCIRVRRDFALAEGEGFKLAIRSLTRLRETYGVLTALGLGLKALRGFWLPTTLALDSQGVICSRLYDIAYMAATGRTISYTGGRPIIPADLSLTGNLEDVPVYWLEIARE